MSRYWSPIVKDLQPYVPGEQPKLNKLTKLNTNENPYGPSPKALAAMREVLGDGLRLYPDPNADSLRGCIAEYYQLDADQVFVGNGSDEVLAHVFHALFQHGKPLLFPDITYSFYPVYCKLYGIPCEAIPLDEDFAIQVADYTGINGGIIFPNPNAPTGRLLALADIRRLLEVNRKWLLCVSYI
ncbi:MAG: pyridoxal phosphate-dependent aminotransferase, partial [Spongiibacter sp.]